MDLADAKSYTDAAKGLRTTAAGTTSTNTATAQGAVNAKATVRLWTVSSFFMRF
jgi:hypothetical protein